MKHSKSISKTDLIHMVDHSQFMQTLAGLVRTGQLTEDGAGLVIRARSKWLWDTFKPADMEWHREFYNRRRHGNEVRQT